VQRSLTSGPKGWPAGQIPWPAGQLLCQFRQKLCGHVSTGEGEGQCCEKSQWRLNSLASQPCALAARPPLGELPPQPSQWSSPSAL
jgi:hypothetical protein